MLLADRVAADVAAEARPAVRVVVKVRYAPFLTRTHGSRVDPPSAAAADIERAALAALDLFTEAGRCGCSASAPSSPRPLLQQSEVA